MSDWKPIFDHEVTGWDSSRNEVYSNYTKNGVTHNQVQWGYDGNGNPNDASGRDSGNHSSYHPGYGQSHYGNYAAHEEGD